MGDSFWPYHVPKVELQKLSRATKKLYEDKFMIISFEDEAKILSLKWSPNTDLMNDRDFKDGLVVFAGFVEPYGANYLLVDVQEFKFMKAMEPELTDWRVKNISTKYNKAGVKKFAFVHGEGFPGTDSEGEKFEGEEFSTNHFGAEEKAMEWLSRV